MQTVVKSVVAVLAVLAAFAQEARASGPYGAFVIRNPTRNTISYEVQWGNGAWKCYSLSPGCKYAHSYPLDANGCAPTPRIRFDYIGGDGQTTYKTYRLDFYTVSNSMNGKSHHFCYSRCGCYLYLYND